jgi:hypothetical protein
MHFCSVNRYLETIQRCFDVRRVYCRSMVISNFNAAQRPEVGSRIVLEFSPSALQVSWLRQGIAPKKVKLDLYQNIETCTLA